MLLYSTLLCKKTARAPGGHKNTMLFKLGGGAKQSRSQMSFSSYSKSFLNSVALICSGHNSGALCRDKKPNDRNDTRTDKQMHELLHEENCSMFHWTQTYFGRSRMFVSQSLDPETLMAKMRAHSCPYVTTINDIF